jgi:hypothetical protein
MACWASSQSHEDSELLCKLHVVDGETEIQQEPQERRQEPRPFKAWTELWRLESASPPPM